METVQNYEFTRPGRVRNPLYDQLAELPEGTTVRFDQRTDFTGEPSKFRTRIIYAMGRRQRTIKTSVKNTSVYIQFLNQPEEKGE